jgi:hypothetical protein
MPAGSTTAVAGTGGLGSGVLASTLRYLLSAPTGNPCEVLVREAVDAVHRHCEQTCVGTRAPTSWLAFLDSEQVSPENLQFLLIGSVLGFSLFLLIDIAYVVKEWWRIGVQTTLRAWAPRVINMYFLPQHASR